MKYLILILTLLLSIPSQALAAREMIDRIVAVVNDDVITQSELDRNLAPIYQDYREKFKGQTFISKMTEARGHVLDQMIEDRLVLQEAKRKELSVSEQEVTRKINEIKSRFQTPEDFQRYLDAQGITITKLRRRHRDILLIQKIQGMEVRSRVAVSPLEARRFYEENPDKFETPAASHVYSITIRKKNPDSGFTRDDKQARNKAEDIRKKITKGGVEFTDAAREYSEDTHAEEGGDMGFISKGEFIPHLEDAIFQLKEGEVSKVLESEIGFHIFKLKENKEKQIKSYEESKKMIERIIFNKKLQERFNEWVARLRNDAFISIH